MVCPWCKGDAPLIESRASCGGPFDGERVMSCAGCGGSWLDRPSVVTAVLALAREED